MGARKNKAINISYDPVKIPTKSIRDREQDFVSGLYKPKRTNRGMSNQPDEASAIGYCSFHKHKGYLSKTMVRNHQCIKKGCKYFTALEHPYWENKYNEKGKKIVDSILRELNTHNYFEYKNEVYVTNNRIEIDRFVQTNHICSINQLRFGVKGDDLWLRIKEKKEDESMAVTFGEQLNVYKNAKHIDVKSLGNRSGLGEFKIRALLADQEVPSAKEVESIAMVFQVPVSTFLRGVDITGANSKADENEVQEKYAQSLNTYKNYPASYRRVISQKISTWALEQSGLSMNELERQVGIPLNMLSKYVRAENAFSVDTLIKFVIGLDSKEIVTTLAFFTKMIEFGDKFIPNYNLNIIKNVTGITYRKIGMILGIQQSNISKASNYIKALSRPSIRKMVEAWDIDSNTFCTKFMSADDFDAAELTKKVNGAEITAEPVDVLPAVSTTMNEITAPKKDPVKVESRIVSNEPVDRVHKMYQRLSNEHKTEVDALIEKYFWEDI